MEKKKLFIDMYKVTDVYKLHSLVFCPETLLESRREFRNLMALPDTKVREKLIKNNLVRKQPSVITNVNSYCVMIFQDYSISTIRKLEQFYDLNFLSTPFRDYPNTFPEAYRWFERRKFSFGDNILLNYRNELTIDYFRQDIDSSKEKGIFNDLIVLFEDEDFSDMREFIYSLE